MTIDLSTEQSKPGENIDLKINADPNSYVGLLGVDQSVLLLKGGNDLEMSAVVDEAVKYEYTDHFNNCYETDTYKYYYRDFKSADVLLITNAKEEFGKIY